MKFSIVINTLGRGYFLKRLLDSLKHLAFKDFEVIVVNGPSADNTEELLKPYLAAIKYRKCPVANLSVSRNIGIKAAAGDIVAFIDDDAVPDKYWLDDLLSIYLENDKWGGVGGKIYDGCRLGKFQCQFVTISKWGVPKDDWTEPQNFNDPSGEMFNIMVGCNCSFRKEALLKVGGFDEYYDYFHDESDLAVRVIRSGYKIAHHERAIVHHSFAASDLRDNNRIIKNWFPIMKNAVYFGVKNSLAVGTMPRQELNNIIRDKSSCFFRNMTWGLDVLSREYKERIELYHNAYDKGFNDGCDSERLLNYDLKADSPFKKFDPSLLPEALSICMLCRSDMREQLGGTAKHTYELATNYAKMGHNVHIITEGDGLSYLQNGINFHFAKPEDLSGINKSLDRFGVCKKNLEYSYGVLKTLNIVDRMYNLDIVEAALWDYESLAASHFIRPPVVIRLQTPSLKVAETQHWEMNDDLYMNADYEKNAMERASGLIYISDAVRETIENLYRIDFTQKPCGKVYLGIDAYKAPDSGKTNINNKQGVSVFFIGRLERRKGLQNIIDALPDIMKEYPNTVFRIAGQNDIVDPVIGCSFKEYCIKKYGEEKWIKNIEFLGTISNDEKESELENCDIFVSPSLYESFGLIFVEAMRHSKPTVGCSVGGMKEVVADGETGLLVPPDDTQKLADALIRLIGNKDLRTRMGERGYTRYKDMFSGEASAKASVEYYKKVIEYYG